MIVNKEILLGILCKVNCMHTLTKRFESYIILTNTKGVIFITIIFVSKPYFS